MLAALSNDALITILLVLGIIALILFIFRGR
jgi:hypothetical protein